MTIKAKLLAEFVIRTSENFIQIEESLSLLLEQLTARPHDSGIIEVQKQREGGLFTQIPVQIAFHIKAFGFHASIAGQPQVRMSLEHIPQIGLTQTR